MSGQDDSDEPPPVALADTIASPQRSPALVDTVADDEPAPARSDDRLVRGALVGRYLVVDVLGAGGMGVVYSAYDPELDRKVAIKLLQARRTTGSGEDQARLLREAQALARLSHPNVVAIYDVGTLAEDRVFIAMELVEGLTLRAWLAAADRSWRDVIPIMLGAGAGLAAAHAAGLVHRDFKPDNVIVGADGRARVMDFGLARLGNDDADRAGAPIATRDLDLRSSLATPLTVAGAILGTPSYMAPEIYNGRPADARSDQFAFGVALYEALYRGAPYDMQALVEGTAKPPQPAARRGVPARIERAVLRALAPAANARFESMDALLRELTADRTAARRRVLFAVGAGVAVTAAVVATTIGSSPSNTCTGLDRKWAGVWDPAIRRKIHDAYVATRLPYAETSFTAVAHALDAYTSEWTSVAIEACEATRVRHDQSEHVRRLRQACLDSRVLEVGALTRELADDPSRQLIERGDAAVFGLEAPTTCSDIQTLLDPSYLPSELQLFGLGNELERIQAQVLTGQYLSSLTAAQRVIDTAHGLGMASIEARARMLRAMTLAGVQNNKEAIDEFIRSAQLALGAGRNDIAAASATQLVALCAVEPGRAGDARAWLAIAKALAARVGPSPEREIPLLAAEGLVAAQSGDPLGAVAAQQKMYALASQMFKDASQPRVSAEMQLATALTRAAEYAQAAPHYEAAIHIQEALLGPDHPDLAIVLTDLGLCYGNLGEVEKARAAYERALAIRERAFGKGSPLLVVPLLDYSDMLNNHGEPAAALPIAQRALQLSAPFGNDDTNHQLVVTTLGEIDTHLGRYDEARRVLDDLLAIELADRSTVLATTLASRADLALAERAWRDAATFAERSV
ncbi:MAG: protein kinase domain-containing protein, partial [Acidobacteriota bacterium]